MRRAAVLAGLAALLLAAQAAPADTLVYDYGGKVHGALEEIMLRVNGVPNMYPRELIQSITFGTGGNDVVILVGGAKRAGRVLTVRFKSADGVLTVARRQIKAVSFGEEDEGAAETETPHTALTEETADEENADQQAVEKDEISSEDLAMREVLGRNRALAQAAFEKADEMKQEDVGGLKDKYMSQCQSVVKDMERLESRIRSALRRREQLEREWYRRDRRYVTDVDRYQEGPRYRDTLEQDKRAYQKAKRRRSSLKKTIGDELDKVKARLRIRKKRARVAYEQLKKKILEGEEVSEDQLMEKYFAALDLQKAKRSGKASTGPLDGKRKANPFDEMFGDSKKKR